MWRLLARRNVAFGAGQISEASQMNVAVNLLALTEVVKRLSGTLYKFGEVIS